MPKGMRNFPCRNSVCITYLPFLPGCMVDGICMSVYPVVTLYKNTYTYITDGSAQEVLCIHVYNNTVCSIIPIDICILHT